MATGTVKFFNTVKGFGFIVPDDGSKEVFVHKSNVKGNLRDGDKVQFETQESAKGLNAVNVSRI